MPWTCLSLSAWTLHITLQLLTFSLSLQETAMPSHLLQSMKWRIHMFIHIHTCCAQHKGLASSGEQTLLVGLPLTISQTHMVLLLQHPDLNPSSAPFMMKAKDSFNLCFREIHTVYDQRKVYNFQTKLKVCNFQTKVDLFFHPLAKVYLSVSPPKKSSANKCCKY